MHLLDLHLGQVLILPIINTELKVRCVFVEGHHLLLRVVVAYSKQGAFHHLNSSLAIISFNLALKIHLSNTDNIIMTSVMLHFIALVRRTSNSHKIKQISFSQINKNSKEQLHHSVG